MKNKKLFAILTLVCFMFTLMPVAAFADADDFSATASVFATATAGADLDKNEKTVAQITLKNAAGNAFTGGTSKPVYIWAEQTAGQPSDAFEASVIDSKSDDYDKDVAGAAIKSVGKGVYEVSNLNSTTAGSNANEAAVSELYVSFLRAGNYTLKASLTNPLTTDEVKDIVLFGGASESYTNVVVNAAAAETELWAVKVEHGKNATIVMDGEESADAKAAVMDGKTQLLAAQKALTVDVDAVGVKTETITLTVLRPEYTGAKISAYAKVPVAQYPVALDTDSSSIAIDTTSATTNHNGQVTFKLSGETEGDYKVFVTVGDIEVVVNVKVGASIANDIEVIKAPEAPVAKDTKNVDYKNIIRFQVTDVNGNVIDKANIGNCTDSTPGAAEAPYVTLLEQPAKSDIKDKEIYLDLVDGESYYTLALNNAESFDVEGTYTAKVILDNGRSATVTWEVKKFTKPAELVLTYTQEAIELNGTAKIDELVYVDEFGVKKAAKDVDLAAAGYAIEQFYPANGDVKVKPDEKYVGSTITVTAVSERYDLVATANIKVTADAAELAFADKAAAVNVNNKIDVQIVDAEGNKVAPTNADKTEIYYVVLDKPEDAKVSVATADESALKTAGKFTMALTSNKVGNVTVQAVLKLTTNTGVVKYYTGTQIFAVGTEGVGDVVVMSIGSNEIVINDEVAVIDAEPIVSNNRTFVPFRALAEAFGATVAYDEATQSVTAELNGVTVVMTIGSATYTVNGVEKTADVAPFIKDGRTMVPVRFAAEAFGIKVIPTYNPDGTTADILFNL